MHWKFWMIISALFILVVFVAQNYKVVEIKFLFWGVSTSRAIVLFITFIAGMIVGSAVTLLRNKNYKTQIKE